MPLNTLNTTIYKTSESFTLDIQSPKNMSSSGSSSSNNNKSDEKAESATVSSEVNNVDGNQLKAATEVVVDEEAEKKAELAKKKEASEELTRRLQNLALERQKVGDICSIFITFFNHLFYQET